MIFFERGHNGILIGYDHADILNGSNGHMIHCESCGGVQNIKTAPKRFNDIIHMVATFPNRFSDANGRFLKKTEHTQPGFLCLSCIEMFSRMKRRLTVVKCVICLCDDNMSKMRRLNNGKKDVWVCCDCVPIVSDAFLLRVKFSKSIEKERRRVWHNNKRAKALGLPATLTLDEWLSVIDEHDGKCIYCGGEFTCLDHIYPIDKGGGTTIGNVVPSCQQCNSSKGTKPLVCTENGWKVLTL